MKKPVVDYRKFRFSKLRDPEYRHMLLLLGWVGYFLLYVLTENLIPPERCHVIHCALDDKIPFCELFLIPYTFWYLLVAGSLLYFFLYDIPSFRTLSIFIIITQVVAMTAYIFYPSIQLLRPETFPRDNLLTRLMAFIYTVDTPTGVCPSLHVAYSVGIASTWCKARSVPRWLSSSALQQPLSSNTRWWISWRPCPCACWRSFWSSVRGGRRVSRRGAADETCHCAQSLQNGFVHSDDFLPRS